MTAKAFLKITLFTLAMVFLNGCNDDDTNNTSAPSTPDSRHVKYEITGNATGDFSITYVSQSGSGVSESYTALPFTKEFTAQAGVPSVSYTTSVQQAVPGQTMTAKLLVGGQVKREDTQTVGANGILVISLQSYVFE